MKILIGIDGSAGSFTAAEQVGRLVAADRDELLLYFSPPMIEIGDGLVAPEILRKAQESFTQAVFAEALGKLPEPVRAKCQTILGDADPRGEILEICKARNIDLLAVGARGLGPLESLLLGSVSRSLVQSSRIPVFVARPVAVATAPGLKVLVATDGSARDTAIANVIGKIAWPPGTEGTCCTVVESMFALKTPAWLTKHARSPEVEAMAKAWRDEHETDKAQRRTEVTAFSEQLPAAFRQPPLVLEGHAAEQIVATVKANSVGLVVLGAYADSSLMTHLLGSTTNAVLAHAPCSILVVPR
jgi:nucleotide-binding universal stress UspA family protein